MQYIEEQIDCRLAGYNLCAIVLILLECIFMSIVFACLLLNLTVGWPEFRLWLAALHENISCVFT